MRYALLVEDDRDQIGEVVRVLERENFEVHVATTYLDASQTLRRNGSVFDLLVLDRRIPERDGEDVLNVWGDLLFQESLERAPDAKVIVFTGFADIDQVMRTTRNRSRLVFKDKETDRVSIYEKDAALEFEDEVHGYADTLRQIDDIDINFDQKSEFDRVIDICTRRVAFEYGAQHAAVQVLVGGMSGSQVWRTRLFGSGGEIAQVVIKVSREAPLPGGIADQIAASRVAAVTQRFRGFSQGHSVCVMQDVHKGAASLGALIRADDLSDFSDVLALVDDALSVSATDAVLTFESVIAPLVSWDRLVELAREWEVVLPSRTMNIAVAMGARHGDLHAENILVVEAHSILIDFDSSCNGSALLDPVTLLLSTLAHESFHKSHGLWPSVDVLQASYGCTGLELGGKLSSLYESVLVLSKGARSSREFWALSLAYCMRQLKYDDVRSEEVVREKVIAIARRASEQLN